MNALTTYVSNVDKRVYTIDNLPEEVIAVIFAYVSRSPNGFRENLAKLLADGQLVYEPGSGGDSDLARAQKIAGDFHERWVIGYGHSSVAEHAVAHVGIEGISRLASSELELASRFNSFTEYSQRYQRPRRGDVYVPPELGRHPEALALYESFQCRAYDVYEALYAGLMADLPNRIPKREGESDRAYRGRLEKMAFEDARYALTLATLTSLGMTGNGRAIRDAIVRLLSGPYAECRELARELEREVGGRLPTLLRHVAPSDYLGDLARKWSRPPGSGADSARGVRECGFGPDAGGKVSPGRPEGAGMSGWSEGPEVHWLSLPDYRKALIDLAVGLWVAFGTHSFEQAQRRAERMDMTQLEQVARCAWEKLPFYEHPHEAFRTIVYQVMLRISEANWHQLLRHNRGAGFTYGPPGVIGGWVIPPRIEEAGLGRELRGFLEFADVVRERLEDCCPEAARYCVTNAHRREVVMTVDLWELYHLINLRTSPEAQWDIRKTFEMMFEQLRLRHPALITGARRRG
ncbi:MAG: FAD-dependent thymidylate synthase [Kyrpidia sp.]|nr:FAD-dependent thymidylate synthase [Kyrpidia sp.]